MIKPKVDDNLRGLCPGRITTDQLFTLQQIFEKFLEYAKDVYKRFVDLEKRTTELLEKTFGSVARDLRGWKYFVRFRPAPAKFKPTPHPAGIWEILPAPAQHL